MGLGKEHPEPLATLHMLFLSGVLQRSHSRAQYHFSSTPSSSPLSYSEQSLLSDGKLQASPLRPPLLSLLAPSPRINFPFSLSTWQPDVFPLAFTPKQNEGCDCAPCPSLCRGFLCMLWEISTSLGRPCVWSLCTGGLCVGMLPASEISVYVKDSNEGYGPCVRSIYV